jgi:hexosaminidase
MWSDQFIQGTILQEIAPINENRSEAYFDYLAFPRMAALAEVLWSGKENQNWNKFQDRMRTHYNRYDHAGYSYRVPQPKPIEKKEEEKGVLIALENMVDHAEIRYTTNGIKPNVYSEIYAGPVRVNRLEDFQAITVVSRKHYSLPLYFPVEYPEFKKFGDQIGQWRPIDLVEGYQVEIIQKATGKINQNGKYRVSFLHVDGNSKLEIEKIMVFKNNSIFSDDINMQILSDENNVVTYQFEVDNYETGTEYTVKAKVKTQNGNDSNGVIFLKMM